MTQKHLVLIYAHNGTRDVVYRHWKHYKKGGADILGVNTVADPFEWPFGNRSVKIGRGGGPWQEDMEKLPRRFVETLEFCLTDEKCKSYDTFFITEYDSMFLKPIPEHPGGLVTTVAGYCPQAWNVKARRFLHPPWWVDRKTCEIMAVEGRRLITNEIFESGSIDIFIGLIADRAEIEVFDGLANNMTWSANGGSLEKETMPNALKAIQKGIFFLHAVRKMSELDTILGSLPPNR